MYYIRSSSDWSEREERRSERADLTRADMKYPFIYTGNWGYSPSWGCLSDKYGLVSGKFIHWGNWQTEGVKLGSLGSNLFPFICKIWRKFHSSWFNHRWPRWELPWECLTCVNIYLHLTNFQLRRKILLCLSFQSLKLRQTPGCCDYDDYVKHQSWSCECCIFMNLPKVISTLTYVFK